ncbi:LysR substrate-binding domain-containing protein [Pseudophaeobacter arcticus]|jgi:LysR family glycine cleavage system transcriptional activator|uniref:LysR substrate-binding domain-containing protein n=1 Tax=Pseudophaeobacter arcticus TaxID=385492 RepID=UPI0004829A55|nr:LysR substrate-binding domain-containing protein [Pseudophaeobacter arcticus]UWS81498.1 LysR substrate-binding domain-containing protein [Phaeobacter sp. G2]
MALRIQDLYTFHVVARAGAMQDAAHELGVTPGAISQRISAVEERHGVRLFTRSKNGIALTTAGLALQSDVSRAFSTIEAAHEKHFVGLGHKLRITTSATFAHSMLVSSLGRFAEAHSAIKVSVETEDRLVNLRSEPVDLAIRHGLGDYPGLQSEWLCSPELMLVASPKLLDRLGPLENPSDCLRYSLLPDATGKDWSIWFEAQGIEASGATYGTQYGNDFLTVKAVIDGQGLALLNDVYVNEGLASGQLVRALGAAWPTAFAYYAVALAEKFERPAVSTFVKWLKKDLDS